MNLFTAAEATANYSSAGKKKTELPFGKMFVLAILAGFEIGVPAAVTQMASYAQTNNSVIRMISDDTFSSTVIRPVSQLFSYDFDAIFDLNRHRPDFFEYDIASHFIAMMKQIIRIYHHTNPDEAVNRNVDLQSLREMLGWIGENYREEITVDQIAAAGKMSRSRCTRLFRRYLQESPIEHVQKYRLERSAYLITNTDLQFSEIASRCGFNQQSYFNRLFSRHFSMTPKQMRSLSILKRREANSRQ